MNEVGILRTLVEAYSPSGQEEGAVRRFIDIARSVGFTASADPMGNAIARIGHGHPTIMFLGHIDTVEGELPVRIEGGTLHGRGTVDAKGPLAAALAAASHHRGPGEIVVVGAVGEERDSRGARYLLPRHRPDALIVGEPSGWSGVTIGYKGRLGLVLRFAGERVHLSAPIPTALETGLAFLDRLRELADDRKGETPFHSLTMRAHSAITNRADDGERAEFGVDFRLPPRIRTQDVLEFLDAARPPVRYDIVDRSEAVLVDPRNEVVRALCAGIRKTGTRPTLLRKLGTSDLNLAAPAWGCPAAAYGPGDAHLDHTDGESLDLGDLRRSIEILRHAFELLGSSAPPTLDIPVPVPPRTA